MAVLAAAGVVALWLALVTTGPGQVVDEVAFAGSARGRDLLDTQAAGVLSVVSEGSLALGVVLVVVVAAVRRRLPLAAASVVVVVGANVTTQVLKAVLPRPALGLGDVNSLPSGHTTVAATLAVALVLVVPASVRSTAAVLGAAYAAATGVSTLVAGWHRPSDVAAALLVVAAWTALAVAGLRVHGGTVTGARARRGGARLVLLVGGSGAVLVGLAAATAAALALDAAGTVVVWRATLDAGPAVELLTYGGGVLVVVGGSAALLGTCLTLLRRTPV